MLHYSVVSPALCTVFEVCYLSPTHLPTTTHILAVMTLSSQRLTPKVMEAVLSRRVQGIWDSLKAYSLLLTNFDSVMGLYNN